MEYTAVAWDPHQCNNIQTLEKIQHRATRRVMNDYNRYSSVSDMLRNLNWQPLRLRHRISRLQMFYAAVHNCLSHNVSYQSFYPRTIKDWNQLPTHRSNNLQSFLSQLTNYMYSLIY